jgi:hypothetical protein
VCYEGDGSRVVDLCRARLVAGDLPRAIAAVTAVAADGGVRVVRAKNSMRAARAPDFSAGFRVRARAPHGLDPRPRARCVCLI